MTNDPVPTPPSDPEEWTDEQWLDWLKATDDDVPAPVSARLARSVGGSVIGEAMRGLANAMYGPKDEEQTIISEAGGQSYDDDPFSVHLDPQHPERSTATFHDERSADSD